MIAIARLSDSSLASPRFEAAPFRLPPATAWLCRAVQAGIVGLLSWRLILMIRFGFDPTAVAAMMQRWERIDIAGVETWQLGALTALNLVLVLGVQLGLYGSLFQLVSGFLRGQVFVRASGLRLRRAALFTLAFVILGPLRNVLATAVLTAHLPGGAHWAFYWWDLNPLHDFVLGAGGFVLGQVFVAAADIAEDNAQIV